MERTEEEVAMRMEAPPSLFSRKAKANFHQCDEAIQQLGTDMELADPFVISQSKATLSPVPLRTLTTLLNYERCASNPRYKGFKLALSSLSGFSPLHFLEKRGSHLLNKPASVTDVHYHEFWYDPDFAAATPATCDAIHPRIQLDSLSPSVRDLTLAQRELIYYESRDRAGCYKSLYLFQMFFELCPDGQQLSIQLRGEKPILVNPNKHLTLGLMLEGPKLLSIDLMVRNPKHPMASYITGAFEKFPHSIMTFALAGLEDFNEENAGAQILVVDMASMQFGEAGRGVLGEPYFFGTFDEYDHLLEGICEGFSMGCPARKGVVLVPPDDEESELLADCAERVWKRWQNRTNEGWCEYCGVGGNELKACGACKENKVYYCCKEHQKVGWKLHKYRCEKYKKEEQCL